MAWSPFSKKSGGSISSTDENNEGNTISMKAQKSAPAKFATPFINGKIGGMTGGTSGGKTGGAPTAGDRTKPGSSKVKKYMPKGPSGKGK